MAGAAQGTPARPALLVATLAAGVTTLSLVQTLVVPVLGTIAEPVARLPRRRRLGADGESARGGLWADRGGSGSRRPTGGGEAAAGGGEWSPVSGIR